MFETLVGLVAILAILLIAAVFYAYTYRAERDELVADLAHERNVAKAFEARINTLRSDNIALEREVGRIKAEKIAAKPKRGPNGRFIPRVKKPDPISCG